MKAKKIIIAVFAVVLAMQMTGCKNNIDTSKPVVIGVSVSENDCLINYIIKTRMFMPAYKKYTFPITSVYDEYSSEEEKLGTLMSSYNEVKEAFSK